jgi:hypothetical protein
MTKLKVGETIPAGTFVLLTSGDETTYGVFGLFRATRDVIVPGAPSKAYSAYAGHMAPDLRELATLLEPVPYAEVWTDGL